ncbi:MAG TPA: NADH-quinone oxidoreductase subunit L [Lacipirellulaceae bacterium]|nr:NADH-quinone oxidoreductase subunit L [Lacipirellulaceae bacterium]HMP05035.1 NADH-quinone oxidoreductase subunit L [Lacipirellulaceae bacterium]
MDVSLLPKLLAIAWLTPLAAFTAIVLFGPRMGKHGKAAGYVSVGAIVTACVLSFVAMFGVWLPKHSLGDHHGDAKAAAEGHAAGTHDEGERHGRSVLPSRFQHVAWQPASDDAHHGDTHEFHDKPAYAGDWYTLGQWGDLKLSIGYYIDALTVTMFCMVTLIASCVHIYALGYMHDELHEPYVDHEVHLSNGEHLKRKGRFYRFFQYLSLFSFSMLGLVIAGNMAMVFVFWELVGICSYFLIGFYIERRSASDAANKAFIVNRVGDFGMLIGMLALWSSVGTFQFGDTKNGAGEVVTSGIFSQLRTAENNYQLRPTKEVIAEEQRPGTLTARLARESSEGQAGQWLLLIAGVGIFCGCVGKSAQFPLHVWLPDAMEGPTPVSALVHSATMVAAGVYLVGRFFPVFTPEALLVIAIIGCITLLLAATIAITATDIKRVLAYSTISQLGYMMLALGLGGWLAGLYHLITHAFFKSLLFLCSGSVIHAVHTNDMMQMGGLRRKMPITAYTMLVGCLAIIGAGIPLTKIGFSGYYSKDAIIEQALSYARVNGGSYWLLFALPTFGAAITAFYMFRLWYLTFAGQPRDHHRYDHAHESPPVMTRPLILLAVLAVAVAWPLGSLSVNNLLEQARPPGTLADAEGVLLARLTIPDEHASHVPAIKTPAGLAAFGAAMAGLLLATLMYLWRRLDPAELKQTFQPIFTLLWNKWYFDELYWAVFVIPSMFLAKQIARFDRSVIDSLLHGTATAAKAGSQVVDAALDRTLVDGSVNTFAHWTWDFGLLLRKLQTGSLRQYVLFIVSGTWLMYFGFILASSIFGS